MSRPACSQTLCFKLFHTEIDGIRSGYYHTRSALNLTYSHLRSQNFLGEKHPYPRGTTRTPLQMSSYTPGVAVLSDYSVSLAIIVTQSTVM